MLQGVPRCPSGRPADGPRRGGAGAAPGAARPRARAAAAAATPHVAPAAAAPEQQPPSPQQRRQRQQQPRQQPRRPRLAAPPSAAAGGSAAPADGAPAAQPLRAAGPGTPPPDYAAIDAQPLNRVVMALFRRKMVAAIGSDSQLEGCGAAGGEGAAPSGRAGDWAGAAGPERVNCCARPAYDPARPKHPPNQAIN
jgi:hypothetical protein